MTLSVVAIGGGHGLHATLSALADLDVAVTAVVSVADDGGSSGRLREQFDILPPGDVRMALAALAPESDMKRLLGYRFDGGGDLAGHSLGNLMLTALWQELGVVEGTAAAARLLRARGIVVPVTEQPHHLVAEIHDEVGSTSVVSGQANIARVESKVIALHTVPQAVAPCRAALSAIDSADVVLLGPGSWHTSVIAPLLIPGIADAINARGAALGLIANLEPANTVVNSAPSEVSAVDRALQSLLTVARLTPDAVFVDRSDAPTAQGTRVVVGNVRAGETCIHDPKMLAHTLRGWLSSLGD